MERLWIRSSRLIQALFIALLALFLRGYLATNGPIEYDEPVYVDNAIFYSTAIRNLQWELALNYELAIEHPVFNKLLYSVALLPFKPIVNGTSMPFDTPLNLVPNYYKLLAMRSVSVAAGSAAVFLLSLINPLAGLLLAVHTFAVKYSSVIYLEAVPLLASLGALLAAKKAFNEDPKGRSRPLVGWLILSALLVGITIASKYIYGVVALGIVLAVLLTHIRRCPKILLWLAGWGLACLLFFILFNPILWISPISRLSESIQFSVIYSNNDPVVLQKAYPVWQPVYWLMLSIPHHSQKLQPFFLRPGDYFILADTLIFMLAVLGLPSLVRRDIFMACWLVAGLFFLFLWRTKWPQYVMVIMPPFCMSAAHGLGLVKSGYCRLADFFDLALR